MGKDKEKQLDKKYFLELFDTLCRGSKSRFQVWADFISCAAISISNGATKPLNNTSEILHSVWDKREQEYLNIINSYSKTEQELFPKMFACIIEELERNPEQDLLGSIYMLAELGNKNNGQFFTPYDICELMAEMSFNRKEVGAILKKGKGYLSVNDSACGGGATLIAARNLYEREFHKLNWQNHVYFVGQDIDRVTAMMCYVQLSLLGCPGWIQVTNTLTNPTPNFPEDAENIFFTPLYFSDVWMLRRLFHNLDLFMKERENN